jgi:DNA-binding NarL/FixJ family response regulator
MSNITVFLADDHAIVRDGLRYLLDAQPDIKVIGDAANGRDAVQLVSELCPDIVIMDIAMPQLNGVDATQKISQVCPSQVIILSMHSTIDHIFRSLNAGARGFVLKESAGIEVVKAVRAVHAGHHYLSTKISDSLIDDYINLAAISGAGGPLSSLSPRECEVLQLVVEGKTNAEIAQILSISVKTVETYRSRFMVKLGIDDLPSLIKLAIQHGVTPLE